MKNKREINTEQVAKADITPRIEYCGGWEAEQEIIMNHYYSRVMWFPKLN